MSRSNHVIIYRSFFRSNFCTSYFSILHLALYLKIFRSTKQSRLLTTLYKKSLGNIVGKEENAGNQHFLLFPHRFLPFPKQFFSFETHLFCRLQILSICRLVKNSHRLSFFLWTRIQDWTFYITLILKKKMYTNPHRVCSKHVLFLMACETFFLTTLFLTHYQTKTV